MLSTNAFIHRPLSLTWRILGITLTPESRILQVHRFHDALDFFSRLPHPVRPEQPCANRWTCRENFCATSHNGLSVGQPIDRTFGLSRVLYGKVEPLALHDPAWWLVLINLRRKRLNEYALGVVDPEEVGVEHGLDDTSDHGDGVPVVILGEESPDPVGNVKRSVSTQREQVVRCNSLCFTCPLQHEQLGKDGNRFQPDGERPEHLVQPVLATLPYRRICVLLSSQLFILTSAGVYLYGNSRPMTAAPPTKYSTLNVS